MSNVSQPVGLTYLNINAIYIFHTQKRDREELICGHPAWSETVDRPGNAGARLHDRLPTSLTREAGLLAGWMSSTPTGVLAAFFLWDFTLAGDTRVFDTL